MGVWHWVSKTLDLFQAKGDEFATLFLTIIIIKIGILSLWLAKWSNEKRSVVSHLVWSRMNRNYWGNFYSLFPEPERWKADLLMSSIYLYSLYMVVPSQSGVKSVHPSLSNPTPPSPLPSWHTRPFSLTYSSGHTKCPNDINSPLLVCPV